MTASGRFRGIVLLLVTTVATTLAAAPPATAAPAEEVSAGLPAAAPAAQPRDRNCRTEPPFAVDDTVCPVGKVDPGPDGQVDVPRGPSFAATAVRERPVGPGTLDPTIPAGEALADRVSAQALDKLAEHGMVTDGRPDPDVHKLLPATADAPVLDLPGPLSDQLHRAAEFVKRATGIDLEELWRALPEGLPLLTYRLCAETATRQVSCSLPRPLLLPVIADVTGDGTPDVLADVLPAVDLQPILDLAGLINALLDQLGDILTELDRLGEILSDPTRLPEHAAALARKLALQPVLDRKRAELAEQREQLVTRLGLGISMLSMRLPTSETAGGPLPAQVWAQYDVPTSLNLAEPKRMSFGFDGFRRGATLSDIDFGTLTADVVRANEGVVDMRTTMFRHAPGDAIATVAGLADLRDRQLVDPTLVSARQSPVPETFSANMVIDTGSTEAAVAVTASEETTLDTLALTNQRSTDPPRDTFTQLVVDKVPTSMSARLSRAGAGQAQLDFNSAAPIDRVALSNYSYTGATLDKVMSGLIDQLPQRMSAKVLAEDDESATVSYRANAAAARSVDVQYLDRPANRTIAEVRLERLPASVDLALDIPGNRVHATTSTPIGLIKAIVQRNGGAITTPGGDHATLATDGDALGLSARLSGLRSFDITYGGTPHAVLNMEPGGQSFLAWASIDRTHLARVDISNVPPTVTVDVEPAERAVHYEASTPIRSLRAAYTNTRSGPTVDATAQQVPSRVDVSFQLGDTYRLQLDASSSLAKLDAYYSPDHVAVVDPARGNDVHGVVAGVPAQVSLDVDVPNRRLTWNASAETGSVFTTFRGPFGGRNWVVAGKVADIPREFTTVYDNDSYRIQPADGAAIGSALVAVTNHANPVAPQGSHLAGHYSESTGDIDASVSVSGVKLAEYTRQAAGYTVNVDAGNDTISFDVGATLMDPNTGADDSKLGALGKFGPVPSNIVFSAGGDGGPFTYTADGATALEAEFWFGKLAALEGIKTPKFDNGASIVQDSCSPGTGCAKLDDDAFCKGDKCFALAGLVNMDGLPDKFSLDLSNENATKVVFENYRPKSKNLDLYLQFDEVLATPMKLLVGAKGLPERVADLVLGPFTMQQSKSDEPDSECEDSGKGNETGELKIKYSSGDDEVLLDSLDVHGEIEAGALGTLGLVGEVTDVPGALDLTASWGKKTTVKLDNSASIDALRLGASFDLNDKPASAALRFTDVPSNLGMDIDASKKGLRTPLFGYDASSSGLDGFFAAEGTFFGKTCPGDLGTYLDIPKVWAELENLGADTRFGIADNGDVKLTSTPATDKVELHAPIVIPAFTEKSFEKYVPIIGTGISGGIGVYGRAGMKKSVIDDVSLNVKNLGGVRILPGKPPVDSIPREFGWLVPGVTEQSERTYDEITFDMAGFELKPDLVLGMNVTAGGKKTNIEAGLRPVDKLHFHHFDSKYRTLAKLEFPGGGLPSWACLQLKARPSYAGPTDGHITLKGSAGPQSFTFLDPEFNSGASMPDLLLTMLLQLTWPHGNADVDLTGKLGGCD